MALVLLEHLLRAGVRLLKLLAHVHVLVELRLAVVNRRLHREDSLDQVEVLSGLLVLVNHILGEVDVGVDRV